MLHVQGAAEACGLSNVTGALKRSLCADLAAFAGNPLDDISAFLRPVFVMVSQGYFKTTRVSLLMLKLVFILLLEQARGKEHSLTPIAPLGDQSEVASVIWNTLRDGLKQNLLPVA